MCRSYNGYRAGMTYKLSDEQKRGVLAADDEKQYAHFLNKVTDWGEVWSLSNGERLARLRDPDDGAKLLPVWPHPDYARDSATDGWDGFEPKAIEIHEFLEHCERLDEQGKAVAILHQPSGDFLHMPAGALAADLQAALDQVE